MPAVLEILKLSSDYLAKRGVDSPRLQAELILAHILRLPRLKLYLNFETLLSTSEVDEMRAIVRRRGQREPLQHLLGSTSFCGFEIKTTPAALIPRPETELLAERGWTFLKSRSAPRFLDFGTGTGCISIAVLQNAPESHGVALDISPAALALAKTNSDLHQLSDRLDLVFGDGFGALDPALRFDLILSNPPYIPSAEIATLDPEVKDHDPLSALNGGEDGLDFYRLLAREASTRLKSDGRLMLEFGDGQAAALREIFLAHNWIVEGVELDYTQRERILLVTPTSS